jgi:hypothetical protein
MPPKQQQRGNGGRWQAQPTLPTPDFNSTSALVTMAGPAPETMSEAIAQLKKYIMRTLGETNLLQLQDAEINSTADIIASCTEKSEIFNWASTLMLPETFAAEVIKRREDITRLGLRTDADNVSTTSLATAATSRSGKKKGAGQRGKTVNLASADKDASGGLVEGQQFECGCFATQHAFRGNCMNCGRIICMQESDDMCYFCNMDPGLCLAYEIKVSEGRVDAAAEAKNRADYDKAVKQRDQLLAYAKERTKRTTVIDDQSGMYANTAWVTEEEREASRVAETDERKRVAAMHRATGAYTVHLDIVNQSAALGATPLLHQAEDAITKREAAGQAGAAVKLTDAEAASKYGLEGGADGGNGSAPQQVSSVPLELLRHKNPIAAESDDDDDDEDNDDVSGGAARVQALPSLVQKIFYGEGKGASNTIVATRRNKDENADGDGDGRAPAPDAGLKPREQLEQKGQARKQAADSRRVQTDYYEDDKVTWRIARQQQRLGAAIGGIESDDDEVPPRQPATVPTRKARPAPPPPSAAGTASDAPGRPPSESPGPSPTVGNRDGVPRALQRALPRRPRLLGGCPQAAPQGRGHVPVDAPAVGLAAHRGHQDA